MNSSLKRNLKRLLHPRHIAFIGGSDAAFSAIQCARAFDGPVWGVNPTRSSMGEVPCFQSVSDLPEPPDAVFIATPREATLEIVSDLRNLGAGAIACFTAGYGELGATGKQHERALVAAAGEMAMVGPNCYGLVNYTNGATLWPFGAGSQQCQSGIALIMQSGMLPANMTMNTRSAPITHIISAGNQSVLAIEHYMEALLEEDSVRAIGIYAEGIKDVQLFTKVAFKALERSKPIAIIKAGRSEVSRALSVTHTGSLSGSDDAFQALFDRIGIIRCHSPAELLETLKFLSISGAPAGSSVAGFTCSGGDAAMLADVCDEVGLALPAPNEQSTKKLRTLLPDIATVSNPLDYTTPLWGDEKVMPTVFETMLGSGYDAAIVIQDFPPPHIHDDLTLYRNDAISFATTCARIGIPAAVCSDLPENIDAATRKILIDRGITPLQGLDNGVSALSHACRYGSRRQRLLKDAGLAQLVSFTGSSALIAGEIIDEAEGKRMLQRAGIPTPNGRSVAVDELKQKFNEFCFPLALKAVSEQLTHKTEVGVVKLNLKDSSELLQAAEEVRTKFDQHYPESVLEHFLIEEMQQNVITELLVGITRDEQFGLVMVIASGGILVELINDKATLLLPTSTRQIEEALTGLKTFPLLLGFRGRPVADIAALVATIQSIANFAIDQVDTLIEMEINPLIVTAEGPVAVDVMIRKSKAN
ncbi:MAG: acetate--CoA ligase family protein [Acidiferrobacterales bacterium]|nr:acetate--CoA ligase family protein [Acidiferrobacterales bacterium]